MIYDRTIGTVIHFGPHSLLPPEFLRFLVCSLECRNCFFRRLYQTIAIEELRLWHSKGRNCDFPFHSLSRAIKAALKGLEMNEKHPRKTIIKAESTASLKFTFGVNYCHNTRVHTTLLIQPYYWVCPHHAEELFELLYYGIIPGTDRQSPVLFSNGNEILSSIIPDGQSEFFRSLQGNKSDGQNCETHYAQRSTSGLFIQSPNCAGYSEQTNLNDRIMDANNKWFSSYGSDVTESSSCESGKRVHFPAGNPVSATHIMRTYATASRLERKDNTWILAACYSFYDDLDTDPQESDPDISNKGNTVQNDNHGNSLPNNALPIPTGSINVVNSSCTASVENLNSNVQKNTPLTNEKKHRRKRRRKRRTINQSPASNLINQICDSHFSATCLEHNELTFFTASRLNSGPNKISTF